jgi:hypothetical protein
LASTLTFQEISEKARNPCNHLLKSLPAVGRRVIRERQYFPRVLSNFYWHPVLERIQSTSDKTPPLLPNHIKKRILDYFSLIISIEWGVCPLAIISNSKG